MIANDEAARHYVAQWAPEGALEQLEELARRLRAENETQNLVSRPSLDAIWSRHFADSAQLLEFVPPDTRGPWLDLGSGAGFPGLVLAILRPGTAFTLVESRRLRVRWLETMCDALGLKNCAIEGSRLEHVESCKAGAISARAFAPLARLLNLSARFSTASTYWVLPKGRSAAQEVSQLPKGIAAMFHVEQSRTDPEAGIIVGQGIVRAPI